MPKPKPKAEKHQDDRTPFERFEELARKLFWVPKEEADEERCKAEREKKRAE